MNTIIEEINAIRERPLEPSYLLSAQATASVLRMAENDDLRPLSNNCVAAKGDVKPHEVVMAWIDSDQYEVLLDLKLTRIGVATCELNGVRYWVVLTK